MHGLRAVNSGLTDKGEKHMKEAIRRLVNAAGFDLHSNDRIGIDVRNDLRRLTAEEPIRCVFDVGGNYGQSALQFASAFPGARVTSFEPVPETYARLKSAIEGCPQITAINKAIGDFQGTLDMHLTDSAGSNSVVGGSGSGPVIKVEADTLDSVASSRGVQAIDLLKIDVEGFELQVLKGAQDLFARSAIRYVFAECVLPSDSLAPHTSFFDIDRVLTGHGLCFVAYYAEGFRLRDGCALGNVLYALKSRLPAKVPGKVANMA